MLLANPDHFNDKFLGVASGAKMPKDGDDNQEYGEEGA
jgi:hypothetical protein